MGRQSLFWQLTPPEGKASYLFGTMHVRDERAYQLCEKLYPLIRRSDRFIAEMNLDAADDPQDLPPYNIHQYISGKKYAKLRKQFLKSFKIDLDKFSHLHPLVIMSVISTSVLQSEHHISLDEHLWEYAKSNNIPAMGLETYDEQFKILHSIDPASVYKQLLKMGENPGLIRKHTHKGMDLYVKQKIHTLYLMSKSSMHRLRKKVIYDRNHHMVSVIDHLDKSLQYFITVGAGHLSGKFGLLSLLKRSGWKLNAIDDLSGLLEE